MHAKVQDDTKLQLKQPNLGWINPTIFIQHRTTGMVGRSNLGRDLNLMIYAKYFSYETVLIVLEE